MFNGEVTTLAMVAAGALAVFLVFMLLYLDLAYERWRREGKLVDLGALEGKTLKRPVAEVSDADLEEMIGRLREQRKTWEEVERTAEEGDQVVFSFVGRESRGGGSPRSAETSQ